ncbi:protein saal1 [Phalaenopsis equestris]|uniref:protein saal1 n=1 Tax=Phalaenopsis equestris TaxID=78828 RepID=UPI0009E41014|nr:protein saal1 [Phalaenopsis equestris]
MTVTGEVSIREAPEESEGKRREEVGAEVWVEDAEGEENGESPSHLPFAPSSELPDTTTVDPSYIISLIRKLLPNNINKQSLNLSETSKVCPLEENKEAESISSKKLLDTEARCEGSINDHFGGQSYSSAPIYNGIGADSIKEDTGSDDQETGFIDEVNTWEDSGCILWDLSTSRTHAEFMVNNFMLEVLLASLHASISPRITEICLGILGNLTCHDVSSNAMTSIDGLIEAVVNQLYLDDSPCLSETFRLLSVALQGIGSTLWAKALLSEQACLRIIWIVGNTLNTILLEKSIDFLLTVINNKEVANVLLLPMIKLGLPNLVVNLLSCEMDNLDDENKPKRPSFLDPILCLVEALSSTECGSEITIPNEELCHLVCRVIKLNEKYEYTSSCVAAVVIIANLLVDEQHIASQLSQDHEFLKGLLETIPFVSDDPQARDALWCILEWLFALVAEPDIEISSLYRLVSLLLEKSSLIMDDLDGHQMEDSSHLNASNTGAIVRTLLRISCIIDGWIAQKNEMIEGTANVVDSEAKAERLRHYCKKYSSALSAPNV